MPFRDLFMETWDAFTSNPIKKLSDFAGRKVHTLTLNQIKNKLLSLTRYASLIYCSRCLQECGLVSTTTHIL